MRIFTAIAALVLLTIAGCTAKEPAPPARSEAPVTTATVERSEVVDAVQSAGTVEPRHEALLSARIMGRIQAVKVSEGDRVKKGGTLIVIDAAEIRAKKAEAGHARDEGVAALAEAEAAKDNADINYSRMKALFDEKAVSKKELDDMTTQHAMAGAKVAQVKAKIAQADAAIKQADVMLGYSVIASPLNGVVVMKSAQVGETAAPGMPLMKVVDDGSLRLVTDVKESGIPGLKLGDKVPVTLDAHPDAETMGTLSEIVPAADPSTRSFSIKIDLPKTKGVMPGMFGRARLPVGRRSAVLLPDGALVEREGVSGVYVVGPDGTVRFQAVRLGERFDKGQEVLSGLSGGETVAVGDISGLSEGMKAVVK
jgi:membrane fusion protein, multidrug efflux system